MDPSEAGDFALELASRAGEIARAAFTTTFTYALKTGPLDAVTSVDLLAEETIITAVRERRPDDAILGEETGLHPGTSGWTWLIDPLDGTTNFTMGVPTYGVTIALRRGDEQVMAVVWDSHLRRGAVAVVGQPVRMVGGSVLRAEPRARVAVALQQGYPVPRDHRGLSGLRTTLESQFQRVFYTWAPSIDLILLLAGHVGAVVAVECAGADHAACRFVAAEAGCDVTVLNGTGAPESRRSYVLSWPDVTERVAKSLPDDLFLDLDQQLVQARALDGEAGPAVVPVSVDELADRRPPRT